MMSKAMTANPFLTRLASIGCPIVPVPMNPIFMVSSDFAGSSGLNANGRYANPLMGAGDGVGGCGAPLRLGPGSSRCLFDRRERFWATASADGAPLHRHSSCVRPLSRPYPGEATRDFGDRIGIVHPLRPVAGSRGGRRA